MRDIAASIRARLLQLAKARREEFEYVLSRYAAERLLYRLSVSAYRQEFILKGATLFRYWTGENHRPTRDVDFLGCGDSSIAHMEAIFAAICQETDDADGLVFLAETIKGEAIREDEEYEGVRIKLEAMLSSARIPLQIDIGFGDAVTPAPQEVELPVLLPLSPARLLVYPQETVIAEKCEAMVKLGLTNSRLKDFYDVWYLATHFDFEGQTLKNALIATFDRRGTSLPSQMPTAFTPEYYNNPSRQTQWQSFIRKVNLPTNQRPTLETAIALLAQFLMPLLTAANSNSPFNQVWIHQSASWQAGSRS